MLNKEPRTETEIIEAIIRVVVFFDLFDYPLSALEIKNYLSVDVSLLEIIRISELIKEIDSKNGFFFLKSRDEIIITRQKRHNYSLRKIKIAKRFAWIFSLLPWVKTIILSNSIGQYNLRDGSDIDFFIITSPNRIWLTRFFCAGIAAILNSRPKDGNKRDKICLSFYITTNNLNLDKLKLAGEDPYFFYWLRSFILLYNKNGVYENFLIANQIGVLNDNQSNLGLKLENKSLIINLFEKIAKRIQYLIMSPDLKRAINNSIGVVINDNVLKLYLRDNRLEYAKKYGNKIHEIFA